MLQREGDIFRFRSLLESYGFHEIVEFFLEELLMLFIRALRIDVDAKGIRQVFLDGSRSDLKARAILFSELHVNPLDLPRMPFQPPLR